MADDAVMRRFRHATMADLPRMRAIYQRARELMAANGNPTQWGSTFPRESVVIDDIKSQRMMLLVDSKDGHERILAQFLRSGTPCGPRLHPLGVDPLRQRACGYASEQQGHAAYSGIEWFRPLWPDPAYRPSFRHYAHRLPASRMVADSH